MEYGIYTEEGSIENQRNRREREYGRKGEAVRELAVTLS
jgi:hypothetical protein